MLWKEKSVEDMVTLGPTAQATLVIMYQNMHKSRGIEGGGSFCLLLIRVGRILSTVSPFKSSQQLVTQPNAKWMHFAHKIKYLA
jgi:hypothetical protein